MEFSKIALSILTLVVVAAPGARAAEIASGGTDATAPRTESSAGLGVSDAERLFSGAIPDLSYLDRKMKSRGASYHCRAVWAKIRNHAVTVRPVAADLSTIRANALRAGISPQNLDRTLATFLKNQESIPNQKFITIVDFSRRSNQERLFTIDLSTGRVESFATTAGRGSDPDGDGYATRFSNKNGSHASSLGCYLAAGEYRGRAGRSLMLHGFEPTNDAACERAVVMHPASYAGGVPARSHGCLALKPKDVRSVYSRVGAGGLICAYHNGKTQSVSEAPTRRSHGGRRSWRRTHRNAHAEARYDYAR